MNIFLCGKPSEFPLKKSTTSSLEDAKNKDGMNNINADFSSYLK